jgi:hypothetical protein
MREFLVKTKNLFFAIIYQSPFVSHQVLNSKGHCPQPTAEQ